MNKDQESLSPRHSSIRVFIAIKLPDEVRSRATAHLQALRSSAADVRVSWQSADKLHLTLKFIGEIDPERVTLVSQATMRAAEQSRPFKLTIEGAGMFPPRGIPRVLWLGVIDSSGALAHLQNLLEEECLSEGFAREEKPFRPHLTLARMRAPQGARELARLHQEKGFDTIEFEVRELYVMRSELGPGGPRYTEISRHELGPLP